MTQSRTSINWRDDIGMTCEDKQRGIAAMACPQVVDIVKTQVLDDKTECLQPFRQ